VSIAQRLEQLRATLPAHVTLVAISKTQPAEAIREAYAAGQRHFGENYAQEWRDKSAALADLTDLVWHFVGGLQSNKVKMLIPGEPQAGPGRPSVAWIQTVDRPSLAQEISRRASAHGSQLRVRALVEVNVGSEASKSGCAQADVPGLVELASRLPGIELRGLMCIPPTEDDPRPHFAALRKLRDALGLADLSMGMSGDYPIAVEEGATLVRVGTALFGARPPHP
jgi:pyridoxal phosphate enzyme (YggS family)